MRQKRPGCPAGWQRAATGRDRATDAARPTCGARSSRCQPSAAAEPHKSLSGAWWQGLFALDSLLDSTLALCARDASGKSGFGDPALEFSPLGAAETQEHSCAWIRIFMG